MKIKEIIIVEGKNDTNTLKSYFDCDTIETNGTHLGKQTLRMIQNAQEKEGSSSLPIRMHQARKYDVRLTNM